MPRRINSNRASSHSRRARRSSARTRGRDDSRGRLRRSRNLTTAGRGCGYRIRYRRSSRRCVAWIRDICAVFSAGRTADSRSAGRVLAVSPRLDGVGDLHDGVGTDGHNAGQRRETVTHQPRRIDADDSRDARSAWAERSPSALSGCSLDRRWWRWATAFSSNGRQPRVATRSFDCLSAQANNLRGVGRVVVDRYRAGDSANSGWREFHRDTALLPGNRARCRCWSR